MNRLKLAALVIISACGQNPGSDKTASGKKDSLAATVTVTPEIKEVKRGEEIDSLRLNVILKEAMEFVEHNIRSEKYYEEYETQPDDSSFLAEVNITIGHLFSNKQRHLLIRRTLPWATYLNLYLINDNELKLLILREQGGMTYIRDTIADVNGDNQKDFLVHWYPSSGCCRRNIYNVYLNQSNKTFTSDYKFINPTFFPRDKIIRGVGYGHKGEVGLYKYKWNGLQVDTIEFIYPDGNNTGQFIKTKKPKYKPTKQDGIVLRTVPKEYHNIESYEWFIDF